LSLSDKNLNYPKHRANHPG